MKSLDDIEKKNPYRVPDNYFDEVNMKIISSLPRELPKPEKKSLIYSLRPYLAVAASVALLLALSYTGIRIFESGKKVLSMSEISTQEISDAYLYESDFTAVEDGIAQTITDMKLPEMSKEEILDCVISENIELNEIYENL